MAFYVRQLIDIFGEPICAYNLSSDYMINEICTDSRLISEGCLFIPLRGENYDGHEFIYQAKEKGAKATLISNDFCKKVPDNFSFWIVKDTLEAYQKLASLNRSQLDISVVAVTGSAGKTTTREFICALLKPLGNVVGSAQNHNNDVGVPLTLLKARPCDSVIVVEMGMRGLGEIERLSYCAKPDIAVITNIGSAHIGLLGGYQEIARAKAEVASYLNPEGLLIIPAGISLLERELEKVWNGRIVRVRLDGDFSKENLFSESLESEELPDADFIGEFNSRQNTLCFEQITYKLPYCGRHNAFNLLIAFAVANELGVSLQELKSSEIHLPPGRSRTLKIGSITILDQTYNSSPESVSNALNLLSFHPGRHFAVLGTMLELGKYSEFFHRKIVEKVLSLGLDGLVVVASGLEAKVMQDVAGNMSRFEVVKTPEEAAVPLNSWIKKGDVVLLKASRGIALEKLIPLISTCD